MCGLFLFASRGSGRSSPLRMALVWIRFEMHFTAMKVPSPDRHPVLGCAFSTAAHCAGHRSPSPTPTQAAPTSEPGSDLTVYLLTFGWGDVVWERFGHNAIWIKDRTRGTDITYNWGMFDFNQPAFLRRFLTGDTKYWMEADRFRRRWSATTRSATARFSRRS